MNNDHTASEARRSFLMKSSTLLSAAGLSLIGGGCTYKAAKADSNQVTQDVNILNAAIELEHEGIAAYQLGATSGLLKPAVVEIGLIFQSHHKTHRDALVKAVETLGGKPADAKSDDEYANAFNASTLKNQEDVLRLALKLEQGAANAYLGLIPSLGNDYHQIAGRMAGDEAYHAAILSNALGLPIPRNALIFG